MTQSGRTTRIDVAAPGPSPLQQFTIERIVPMHISKLDVSFTNSAMFMVLTVLLITALVLLTTRNARLVPSRWQSVTEMFYETIAKMIDEDVGNGGEKYFPFVFSLFMFILFGNFLGM